MAAYNFRPFLPFIHLGAFAPWVFLGPGVRFVAAAMRRSSRGSWFSLRSQQKGWRHSVPYQSLSLSLSLLLTLSSDPPPVAASQNIHEICPAKRLPFTQSHPLLSASLSILTFWVSLLKGKQKDIQAISFPALKLFTFCTYADPRSDLPEGSRRSCQIQLGAPSKTPSTALAVRRGKSSHSLVDDTQWDRITWQQTDAIVQKIVQKSVDRGRRL